MSKPTTPAFTAMSYSDWVEAYQPQPNTTTPNAPFDGTMYETFGADLEVIFKRASNINAVARRKVWTLVENDDGDWIVVDGYQRVNRMGYFITAKPAVAGTQYEVTLD